MTGTLIQRLRRHRGDYVEEMDEAADALEQQAAQIEALQLTKAGLIDSLREEMDEGLRLRELGGALPNENITAMTERLIGERAALAAELSALRADAERYRWLRRTTNAVTSKGERIDVRNNPELWDSAIDAALRQEQPKEEGA